MSSVLTTIQIAWTARTVLAEYLGHVKGRRSVACRVVVREPLVDNITIRVVNLL